ncbi:MAG: 5-formyltetrahydrofolate cyclo-ligase [Actinomycetes bacterium]
MQQRDVPTDPPTAGRTDPPGGGVAAQKARWRRRLTSARRDRPADERGTADVALRDRVLDLPELTGVRTLAAYVSLATEPPTGRLLTALLGAGLEILVPVVQPDLDLDWTVYRGEHEMQAGPLGIGEPTGPRLGLDAVSRADLVVVPALAVDREGHRLGKGAGCYDRALAHARPYVRLVALVFDDELVESLPYARHDRDVDLVVTPRRTVRLRGL